MIQVGHHYVLRIAEKANTSVTTGGTQLYSLWNSTDPFQSMILSYEVAFDEGYEFVLGGKLPGIRGGPDPNGCSGGSQPNGSDCFSVRIMWRTNGAGEAYSYLLPVDGLCDDDNVICNQDDFGISMGRGSFTFTPGEYALFHPGILSIKADV